MHSNHVIVELDVGSHSPSLRRQSLQDRTDKDADNHSRLLGCSCSTSKDPVNNGIRP